MATRAWVMAVCGGGMLATSCTRDNPAFQDAEGPPGVTTDSVDGGRTDGATGEPTTETNATGGGDATSQGTADTTATTPATSDTMPIDTGDPSSGGSSTGEPLDCMLHELDPIEIIVESNGMPFLPILCTDTIQPLDGPLSADGGSIFQGTCGFCGCPGEMGLRLSFSGTLAPPMVPECGRLVVWAGPDPEGGCRWEGFALFEAAVASTPFFVAANSRNLPAIPFGNVNVELHEEALCAGDFSCTPTPGRHALIFADDTPVFVGAPLDVTIGFANATVFTVTNRMASVGAPLCDERVAWEATVAP